MNRWRRERRRSESGRRISRIILNTRAASVVERNRRERGRHTGEDGGEVDDEGGEEDVGEGGVGGG